VPTPVTPDHHARGDELRWWQWGPPAAALLAVFVLLLIGDEEDALRGIAAFGAVCAVVCQLLEVVREQFKFAAAHEGDDSTRTTFEQRAFHAKQTARLWGLLAVLTALGAIAPVRGERYVAAGLLVVGGAVLLLIARDVARDRPPTRISARALRALGTATLVAGVLLAGGVGIVQ
jgi:hypothetical protein